MFNIFSLSYVLFLLPNVVQTSIYTSSVCMHPSIILISINNSIYEIDYNNNNCFIYMY